MAILPQNLDYTDKDFDALRARLYALIQSIFPSWTDENVANFGNLLVELFCFVGDVLGFYMDNQGRESRIVTAQQRKNVIALAQQLGYEPSGATAAQATETFTLSGVTAGNVVLPAGYVVETKDVNAPVQFQLLAPLTIPAGQTTGSAIVENSESEEDAFTSTGLPNQSFVLSETPYLDDSLSIVAADGSYTQVDNFLSSGAGDKNFTVSVDQNDVATVTFGNGVNGSIPSGAIAASYKTGGGSVGMVDPGAICLAAQSNVTDELGNPVSVTVTNAQASEGGTDRQSLNSIKAAAPASLRAETRCVSLEDFEINAEKVPGVARALMQTSNQDPAVEENTGNLYIVPNGGGVAPQSLLSAVLTQVTVTYPSTLTFVVNALTAEYATVNVQATLFFRAGTAPATGAANVRAALAAWFEISEPDGTPNEDIDFGQNYLDANGNPDPRVALSDLQDVVATATGIRRVGGNAGDFLLNGGHADVILTGRQFPQLGSVTLIDGTTGNLL